MADFRTDIRPARYAGNPTIALPVGTWYEAQVYDFVVMVDPLDATKLVMYCSGMAAPVNTGVQSIGRFTATVANPHAWTDHGQILIATEAWEFGNLRIGSMVYDSGTWYLFYSGGGNSSNGMDGAIGVATSSDGINFTKSLSNPLVTAAGNGRDDGGFTTLPAVLKEGNQWTMVYCYGTPQSILPGLRFATSPDGVTWTKGGSGDILTTSPQYCEFHQLTKINGLYYIFYESGSPDPNPVNYRIFGASSGSPRTAFTKLPVNPILMESGVDPSFDRYHVATPCVTQVNGRWLLFYCGAGEHGFPYNTNHWPGGVAEWASRESGGTKEPAE